MKHAAADETCSFITICDILEQIKMTKHDFTQVLCISRVCVMD